MVRALAGLAFIGALGAAGAAAYAWHHYGRGLPDHAALKDYEPPVMSRVYAGDSRLLAELAAERRIFVPIDSIPKLVQDAFVSAEDQNFWTHPGVDAIAILRAAITNLQQLGQGRRPVGASTITQQVAKNMLLGNEVSIERKLREAILAMRIEQAMPKERILELYLNEIFLGQGAYGVGAAAMTYFGKALEELTPAEAAYLAALPKAPNNYNPFRHPEAAKSRRDWVLERMAEDGVLDRAAVEAAKATPIQVRPGRFAERVPAEYFAEEVRRQLIERFGEEATTQGGLTVRTSLDPRLQQLADRALREGQIDYDRRRGGWRGPVAKIELPAAQLAAGWTEALAALPRPPGLLPEWRQAVVLEVTAQSARVGWLERPERPNLPPRPRIMTMPLAEMAWARPALPENRLGPAPRAATEVVSVGDVVLVEPLPAEPAVAAARGRPARPALPERAALRQIPEVEGAGRARPLDRPRAGAHRRLVLRPLLVQPRHAGAAPARLVLQALRLSRGAREGVLAGTEGAGRALRGRSRPRPGALAADQLHGDRVRRADADARRAREVEEPDDHQAGRARRARRGRRCRPPLRRDRRHGAQLRHGARRRRDDRDPHGRRLCRLRQRRQAGDADGDRLRAGSPGPRDLPRRPAFLRALRRAGTGRGAARSARHPRARDRSGLRLPDGVDAAGRDPARHRGRANIGRPAAGKTGTTNDWLDAWFVGFTPELVVAVWIGFDEPRPLGLARDNETGGRVAAPIFAQFMREALEGRPALPFRVPGGVRMVWVNPQTGELAQPGAPGAILEAFKPGSEPGAAGATGVIGGEGGGRPAAAALDAGLGGLY